MAKPFFVKDCALGVMSAGEAASSLIQFKEVLTRIPTSSLYFHFWGRHFRTSSAHPELHNDFARWAYLHLHDHVLAERLGIVDPMDFDNLEELKKMLLELLEQRLDEVEHYMWTTTRENRFHFLSSVIIVYDTTTTISTPADLKSTLPTLTTSSLFYHFIDARRRTPTGTDDFSFWLAEEGIDGELLLKVQHIDPYFLSLTEQRQKLTDIMVGYFE
jgi:hypothetical protein